MICPKCGHDNVDGDKFCVHCGAELKPELVCPQCGAKLIPGEKFCGACGARIDEPAEFPKRREPVGEQAEEEPDDVPDQDAEEYEETENFPDEQPRQPPFGHSTAQPWYVKYKWAIVGVVALVVVAVGAFVYTSGGNKEDSFVKSAVTISGRLDQNNEQFINDVRKLKASDTDSDKKSLVASMKKEKQNLATITKDYEKLTTPDKYRSDDTAVKKLLKAQDEVYGDVIAIAGESETNAAIDKANSMQGAIDEAKGTAESIRIPGSKFASAGNMSAISDYVEEYLEGRKKADDAQSQAKAKAKAATEVSYFQYTNSRAGYSIDIPSSFVQISGNANSPYGSFVDNNTGARISTGAYANRRQVNAAGLYNEEASHLTNANITYTASGSNWYVIAYTRQGTSTYKKVFVSPEAVNQFSLNFSVALKDQYEPIINHMEPSFHHGWQ